MNSDAGSAPRLDGHAPRRVLFVLSWDPRKPGGVTTTVLSLYDQIDHMPGWGSHLLVESWPHRQPTTQKIEGRAVSYCRIPILYNRGHALRSLVSFVVSFIPAALRYRRLLRNLGIVVVNLHFPNMESAFWTLMKRVRLFKGEVVLSFHGADVTQIENCSTRYERVIWRIIVANCTSLTACSPRLSADLHRLFPSNADKILHLPNGVDARKILAEAQAAELHNGPPRAPYILCITGFEYNKGVDILLRAFVSVRENHPDVVLKLLCRSGPDAMDTRRLIRDLGIEEAVTIETDCPHAVAMVLLKGAAALIVPSRREAYGLSILEAAVLARPVVVTNVCGALDSLDRSLVTVVAVDDEVALAQGIGRVLSDRRAAEAKSARLKRAICDDFNWSRGAQVLLSTVLEK